MLNGDTRLRVCNRCKYDIGVITIAGLPINIPAGSMQLLTVNDIIYIESSCNNKKFFAAKMLVPVNLEGVEVPLEEIGLYSDEQQERVDDEEITAMLKQSPKKIEAWLNGIEDETELHSVYMVAKDMDLPMSKLKVLKSFMPNKDWLDER